MNNSAGVFDSNFVKMSVNGLLVISNFKNLSKTLNAAKEYITSVLYIHLNLGIRRLSPAHAIRQVYSKLLNCSSSQMDVRVLVTPLKVPGNVKLNADVELFLFDQKLPDALYSDIKKKYTIKKEPPIYLGDDNTDNDDTTEELVSNDNKMYDNVVLGGTFDRIHVGHKIFLTEAVLRCRKRLVVGVTDTNMVKSKRLPELILPVQERIRLVQEYLKDIDNTLEYEVVPIQDPFGPTRTDPQMDLIVVSAETFRGGEKVNEIRKSSGLNPLEIHCIEMIEVDSSNQHKEKKISSGNARIDMLGTRLRQPEDRSHLRNRPYIIGLTGGIGSGKSIMAERFANLGAQVIDCDKVAHEIYEPNQICYKKIVEHFGEAILGEDMKINRRKLGEIVFGDKEKLEVLNQIVWPEIMKEAKKRIYNLDEKKLHQVVILEAAVLLKAGWERECHEVWSMIIPPSEAIKRLKNRNNLSEEEAQKRIASQLDNATVVQKSNVVFSSEWSYEFTQEQANKAWDMLMKELESI